MIVSSESDNDENSESNEPESCSSQTTVRLKVDLPSLAMVCDRHRISDRPAGTLASAILEGFGFISLGNMVKGKHGKYYFDKS